SGRAVGDCYYRECYARWKRWLLGESGRIVSASESLSGFELRACLAAYGLSLLEEWRKTVFEDCRGDLYRRLCVVCCIPTEICAHVLHECFGQRNPVQLESMLNCEFGLGFITRDRGGAAEEKAGIIEFRCLSNDRTPGRMVDLMTLKSIFSRQLPRMPREYITRLTFDRQHYSFCLVKGGRVIGGVCFRPFFQSRFVEIVFLAITSTEQVKGYGTRLMNHLKEYLRHRSFEYFLTYADNFALGYFRKQGFSTTITMSKDRWVGFIKDYDGGTLMECVINPNINYLSLGDAFVNQRKMVLKTMRLVSTPKIYSGASLWEDVSKLPEHVDPSTIPGFLENGWANYEKNTKQRAALPLNEQILKFIEQMSKHESSWPFQKPVSKQIAPDYKDYIKHPMDISLMRKNAKSKVYKSKDEFGAHLKLMFDNCRYYNGEGSTYYRLANELETAIAPAFEELIDD
ncbi:putative histone acetyltransferase GCN5, partial [Gregarina niphandrodes]